MPNKKQVCIVLGWYELDLTTAEIETDTDGAALLFKDCKKAEDYAKDRFSGVEHTNWRTISIPDIRP